MENGFSHKWNERTHKLEDKVTEGVKKGDRSRLPLKDRTINHLICSKGHLG